MKKVKNVRYNLFFRPEPEGGFTVVVPALPGCVTYGKNLYEAQEMARDAITVYLASLKKHREPLPPSDADSFLGSVELQLATPMSTHA